MYAIYIMVKTSKKLHSKRNKTQKKQKIGFRKVSNKHVRTHRKKMSLRSPEIPLKKVADENVFECENVKHGCEWQADKFKCFNSIKYKKNKNKPDKVTFTNKRKGTRKLKTPVIRVGGWFDCSHFPGAKRP
jgi:hypothetical protein